MTVLDTQPRLSEAHMHGLLDSLGLAVHYVRGEGNYLYRQGGEESPVLDLVGGYGTTLFGHNYPPFAALVRELLDSHVPLHTQFSSHPYANDLALALNAVLQREFGATELYTAVFGNTGAEGIEIALKHAELDRIKRIDAITDRIETALESLAIEMLAGNIKTDEAYRKLNPDSSETNNAKTLVEQIRQRNETVVEGLAPLVVAFEGGFHGKLATSVQLTHNISYRHPFRKLALQSIFVPLDQPGEIERVITATKTVVLEPYVLDGAILLREIPLPDIVAIVLEPVQGEGGINTLTAELAREIEQIAADTRIPIIVDEVQSGTGRTGAFFAASHVNLLGDYIVLAKAIGGGLTKSSVVLFRESRYHTDFELIHSSTFAKDPLSCYVGIEVVRALEAEGGEAYRQITERGAAIRTALEPIQKKYPHVIAEVRGQGLMLGLRFHDLTESPSSVLRHYAQSGLIGYVLAGYLLREHNIRILPTASADHTLRIEPSIGISDEDIDAFVAGIHQLCTHLDRNDDTALLP